ncbi:hypothetical protein ANN_19346 [Periplaneta americana]|uniref:DUF659 domain-containing protein n=1 Tax=Periplaneta americana TaxID=6978 RepID=A0ABQ8SAJ7_PERAM|nr:hypothetical protein ANN_19346 [Periplaneta americana]
MTGRLIIQFNEPVPLVYLKYQSPTFIPYLNMKIRTKGNKEQQSNTAEEDIYVQHAYEKYLSEVKCKLQNEKIWVSVDEGMNSVGHHVANVVVAALSAECCCRPYLLMGEVLERVNYSSICELFDSAMVFLWPSCVQFENVLLYVTDAASYMKKSAKFLETRYPNMIHVTCVAHACHRLAEEVRAQFPDVNRLIANAKKKVFVKTPHRVSQFKQQCSQVPSPPCSVIRWGSLLNACIYCSDIFESVKNVIQSFLSTAIEALEESGAELVTQIHLVTNIVSNLNRVESDVWKRVSAKMKTMLDANDGYQTLSEIADVLSNKCDNAGEMSPGSSTESYPAFARIGLRKNSGKNLNQRIPNLSAEQSDGITTFRISTMTSLMLHRCRTGAISLQRWWQSPSAAISESDGSFQHKKIIRAHAHSFGGVIGDGEHAGRESIRHLRETVTHAGFCALSFVCWMPKVFILLSNAIVGDSVCDFICDPKVLLRNTVAIATDLGKLVTQMQLERSEVAFYIFTNGSTLSVFRISADRWTSMTSRCSEIGTKLLEGSMPVKAAVRVVVCATLARVCEIFILSSRSKKREHKQFIS